MKKHLVGVFSFARTTPPDQNPYYRGRTPSFLYDETAVVPDECVGGTKLIRFMRLIRFFNVHDYARPRHQFLPI